MVAATNQIVTVCKVSTPCIYRPITNTYSIHSLCSLFCGWPCPSYSPYTSTFQEFNENQRRKAAKEWLNPGD